MKFERKINYQQANERLNEKYSQNTFQIVISKILNYIYSWRY
jgi:hypothetical protein